MKRPSKRDIPAGAVLSILALVLLATVVTGRDDSGAPGRVVEATATPLPTAPRVDRTVSAEDLDLDRLTRPKRESAPQDLFANRSWIPPLPPAVDVVVQKPAPPPAPSAPPLPFKYLGRMADSEKFVVFLEKGTEALSVSVGDVLDNTYEVQMISETAVRFVYLPLGIAQLLPLPASN